MKSILILTIVLAAVAVSYQKVNLHPLSDEFISTINSRNSTWKAGRNFAIDTPLPSIKKLLGVLPRNEATPKLPIKEHAPFDELPVIFDARVVWPDCTEIISEIRDQANCGSCWAVAAAEAMSDRLCIRSKGTRKVRVSAEDILQCCTSCGFGCEGGYPQAVWGSWIGGIVTGGNYGTKDGCKAYSFPPCNHHVEGRYEPCGDTGDTPRCVRDCDAGTNLGYVQEKIYGTGYYISSKVSNIQTEILKNGPVEADFDVYEDFLQYKSGVYQHLEGEYAGGHAVKLLGWGEEEDGTPYWLAANSWNEDWGDKGYFKILRGFDECGIESDVLGGIPNA